MFENGLFSTSSPGCRSGWLKKAVSLAVSLAAHAVALVLLVVYYSPLKILDFDAYVREVYIAPPLGRLLFPDQAASASDSVQSPGPGASTSTPAASGATLPAVLAETRSQGELTLPERIDVPPLLKERFDLRPPPKERTELPPDLSFQIAPERALPRYAYEPPPGRVLLRGDMSRYIQPAFPRLEPEAGSRPALRTGRPKTVGSDAVSRQVEIARWADLAVAMIMERWQVPHLTADQEEDEFEISVVIQRDGWIASTEVIKPARVPQLLAAALKALELSSPLPRLPRSYSQNSLEIRLVFARK